MTSCDPDDLVSVIIPTYNRAALVGDAIESALAQDHPAVEIIVVDDGSTDGTSTVLAGYPTIRVVRQANRGQGAAREGGLELASGRFLATLDSDDLWNPDFLSRSLKGLRASGAGFVFSNWSTHRSEGEPVSEGTLAELGFLAEEPASMAEGWRVLSVESTRKVFVRHCPAPSSSFLVDRRKVTRGWDSRFLISDDWALLLELVLEEEVHCAYQEEALWRKRVDGSNICDQHADPGRLAEKEAHDLCLLLEKFGRLMTVAERSYLKSRMVRSQRDKAHFQSLIPGKRRAAILSSLTIFRDHRSSRDAVLLGKCLLRAWFGMRD